MNYGLFSYQQSIRDFAEAGDEAMSKSPTLDDYIARLLELRELHGGSLPVEKWTPAKGRHAAPLPELAHRRTYDARRGTIDPAPAFFHEPTDNPVQRGLPVVRV